MNTDEMHLQQLRQDGYCVLSSVIPEPQCENIRERVAAVVARERSAYPNAPRLVGFTPGLINHEQSYAPYLAAPPLIKLLTTTLGEHLRISFTSAIINEPGNARGDWHADWPFNQTNAGRVRAPYPDHLMHITTLWMLSPFSDQNGGTLIVPGSHLRSSNPTAIKAGLSGDAVHEIPPPDATLAEEVHVSGGAGDVLIMDSRLWHATAPNQTDRPRVALAVRYAPWWLHLEVLRPESPERERMCRESERTDNIVPSVNQAAFDSLPVDIKPLYQHWLRRSDADP